MKPNKGAQPLIHHVHRASLVLAIQAALSVFGYAQLPPGAPALNAPKINSPMLKAPTPAAQVQLAPLQIQSRADYSKLQGKSDSDMIQLKDRQMTVSEFKKSFKSSAAAPQGAKLGKPKSAIPAFVQRRMLLVPSSQVMSGVAPAGLSPARLNYEKTIQANAKARQSRQSLANNNASVKATAMGLAAPVSAVGSAMLWSSTACDESHARYQYADGTPGNSPRATRLNGQLKPGGVFYVQGRCFGAQNGRVRVIGNFPGGFVEPKIDLWRDDLAILEMPEGLNASDHSVQIQVRTSKQQYSNELRAAAYDGVEPPAPSPPDSPAPPPEPAPSPAAPPPPPRMIDYPYDAQQMFVTQCGQNQGSRERGGDSCLGANTLGSSSGVKAAGFQPFGYVADTSEFRGGIRGSGAHTNFSASEWTRPFSGEDKWELRHPKGCWVPQQDVNSSVGSINPSWEDFEDKVILTVKWEANYCWSYGNWTDKDYSCDVQYAISNTVVQCPEGTRP